MNRRKIFTVAMIFAVVLVNLTFGDVARPAWPLWKINADGTGLAPFADTPGYSCGSPDWSPDGKYVAYDTWPVEKTFSDSQVAIVPADGSQPPRLLGPGAMPSWSPDGTQLVCHTYPGAYQTHQIVVMKADGTGREPILNHWGSPRWSPRGDLIASIGVDRGIALFDLGTGKERSVLRGPFTLNHGFSISPDGRRVCFGDTDGGVALAMLDDRMTQATVRWLVRSGSCTHSSWSPDGTRVVFQWQPPNQKLEQLYVMNVDSDETPTWLPGQDRTRNNINPDWSPDGKTIVFSSFLPAKNPQSAQ
ncbi:MAG: hypothetical protein L0228_04690 [Planctomycetes bacterium]|nr:hypothetical protein [Planctomycetota bacterium]